MAKFTAEKVKVEIDGHNAVVGVFFRARLDEDNSAKDHHEFLRDALGEAAYLGATPPPDEEFGLFSLHAKRPGIDHKSDLAVAREDLEPLVERLLGRALPGKVEEPCKHPNAVHSHDEDYWECPDCGEKGGSDA